MSDRCRRAATVGLSGPGLRAAESALSAAGFRDIRSARDGLSGLRLLKAFEPEAALVSAVLPGMDGLAFIERARRLRLDVVPGLLLLLPGGMALPGLERLDALEATAIPWPTDADSLGRAISSIGGGWAPLPPDKAVRLEALLDELGVPRHPGRRCLALAVGLVWRDRRRLSGMGENLYPELFRRTGLTPAQAERAMRHAIDVAWRVGEIERQHRIFGDTIDARRGKPTCGEMIAQLAEELRQEGPQ